MKRFRVVPIDEAREGVLLSDDVRDDDGNLVLPRATARSGAMIRTLARRGIGAVRIVDEALTEEQLGAERLRVQARLSWLCRHAGDGRAIGLLRTVVEQYRMAGLA
jgi:hypothetical protein